MTAAERLGTLIEADEIRYMGQEISALYDAAGYPLARRAGPHH
jgi:hypothetical protein